jgi:hypothetical protein
LFLVLARAACAASAAQAITPLDVSVLGNETKTFSVRFVDASGRPAAGETVQFVNDACGWFPNGGSVVATRTDANGVASTQFTAYNQGITCYVLASAGAQVRFNVLTFTRGQVYFTASKSPREPRPGQPYKLEVAVMAGQYRLYDQAVAATVMPVTASATLAATSGNTGASGSTTFAVTPDARVGDYDIELDWRGKTQRVAVKAPAQPWKDMWWAGPAENGWGMSIVQHGDMLFNVIYAYDAAGKPTWLVMPGGTWNDAKTLFEGALYRPHGTPFSAYDAGGLDVGSAVGHASLAFLDGGTVVLDGTVDGIALRKTLTRQYFGLEDSPALPADFGDMWWGGAAQNGWGMAMLQQYRTLFGVWFTYDAQGAPTWFVLPSGFWSDASTYEGRVYRTTGSPWLGAAYDAHAFRSADAGPFRLRFSGAGARLDYSIDGRSGSLELDRQPF